jgi:hypothetical protein
MQIVQKVGANGVASEEDGGPARTQGPARRPAFFTYAALALLVLILTGSWLVWFSQYLYHRMAMQDILGACARLMPDNKERCADTVIIQRGGARR